MSQDETIVVHCKRDSYDVYIGRPSKWGNPFKVGRDGIQGECVDFYRDWIRQPAQIALFNAVKSELKGKRLGCWCKPKLCHGDVLVEIIEGRLLNDTG